MQVIRQPPNVFKGSTTARGRRRARKRQKENITRVTIDNSEEISLLKKLGLIAVMATLLWITSIGFVIHSIGG